MPTRPASYDGTPSLLAQACAVGGSGTRRRVHSPVLATSTIVVSVTAVQPHTFQDEIEVLGVAKGKQSVTLTAATSQLVQRVRFTDGQQVAKGAVLIEEALKALETEFEENFVRIHRNCLVARERLTGLTRSADGRIFAKLDGVAEPLEVSRRNLPGLRKLVRNL